MKLFLTALLITSSLYAAAAPDDGLPPVAKSASDVHPLGPGDTVPQGLLKDIDGKDYDLNASIAKTPTVLIFYRGGWCPYCNIQMGQLIKLEPRLQSLGYQILGISPDKPESLVESLKKNSINYTLLSDSPMTLTRRFGLAWKVGAFRKLHFSLTGVDLAGASGQKHYWLPVPAAYVVDRKGKIMYRFYDPDYTKRVDPEELFNAAKAALLP